MDADGTDRLSHHRVADSRLAAPAGRRTARRSRCTRDAPGDVYVTGCRRQRPGEPHEQRQAVRRPSPRGRRTAPRSPSPRARRARADLRHGRGRQRPASTSASPPYAMSPVLVARRHEDRVQLRRARRRTPTSGSWTPNGANRTALTDAARLRRSTPTGPPDSRKIAFTSHRDGARRDLGDGRRRQRPGQPHGNTGASRRGPPGRRVSRELAAQQQRGRFGRRQRARQVVALGHRAALVAEERALLLGLHALGHHLAPERLGQPDDRGDHRRGARRCAARRA